MSFPDDKDGMRFCSGCNEWHSFDNFRKRKYGSGNLDRICKKCQLEQARKARQKRKQNYVPQDPSYTKTCPGCKESKTANNFRPSPDKHNGLRSRCKDCERFDNILKKYNLTKEEFMIIFHKQDQKCCICKIDLTMKNTKQIHVDHDHETNKVRGILCYSCNYALGLLKDNPELFETAAQYIRFHKLAHIKINDDKTNENIK